MEEKKETPQEDNTQSGKWVSDECLEILDCVSSIANVFMPLIVILSLLSGNGNCHCHHYSPVTATTSPVILSGLNTNPTS